MNSLKCHKVCFYCMFKTRSTKTYLNYSADRLSETREWAFNELTKGKYGSNYSQVFFQTAFLKNVEISQRLVNFQKSSLINTTEQDYVYLYIWQVNVGYFYTCWVISLRFPKRLGTPNKISPLVAKLCNMVIYFKIIYFISFKMVYLQQ